MFTIRNIQLVDSFLILVLIGLLLSLGGVLNYSLAGAFAVLFIARLPVFWPKGWDENSSRGWALFGLSLTVFLVAINMTLFIL